jgi:hypothetical protein
VNFNNKKKLREFGIDKIECFHDHLGGFFKFYETFDFVKNVICAYLGRSISVSNYPGEDEELKKFKEQIKSFNKQAVNIADMLNLNFNVAYNVGKKRAHRFKPFCGRAHELLTERLSKE